MRDTATGCSSKPSQDVTACITDVCSASLYNWHIIFYSGQLRAPRPPCIFGSVFTMAQWAVVGPRHTEWTWDWASYRTRTRGGDQWSSGGQNITTNSGQCGEIIMIRFICALPSVLWALCPISPHYEGHYHAAPAQFVACQIEIISIKCVSLPRTTIWMWILWIGCVLDVNMVMCGAVDCDGGCIVRSWS